MTDEKNGETPEEAAADYGADGHVWALAQMPHEDRSRTRENDSILRDRIVERHFAFVDQLEDHRTREGLRQRREVKDRRIRYGGRAERRAPDDRLIFGDDRGDRFDMSAHAELIEIGAKVGE